MPIFFLQDFNFRLFFFCSPGSSYSQPIDLTTLLQKPTTQSSLSSVSNAQSTSSLLQFQSPQQAQQATSTLKASLGIDGSSTGAGSVAGSGPSAVPSASAAVPQPGSGGQQKEGGAMSYASYANQASSYAQASANSGTCLKLHNIFSTLFVSLNSGDEGNVNFFRHFFGTFLFREF